MQVYNISNQISICDACCGLIFRISTEYTLFSPFKFERICTIGLSFVDLEMSVRDLFLKGRKLTNFLERQEF